MRPPALFDAACYSDPAARIELIETHISWVFLAGEYAYKVKKPVKLSFLDFSDLAARRSFCDEELRLNRRTAPELYLAVVPISSTPSGLRVGAESNIVEWAVKMRRFSQDALGEHLARLDQLDYRRVDALAAVTTAFHVAIPRANKDERFGECDAVIGPAQANFTDILSRTLDSATVARVQALREWNLGESSRLRETFTARKHEGFVRECHGDLHLNNIVFEKERPLLFDCIEFSPELRWIDVMSDVAFLVMDMRRLGREHAAFRFLNGYLESTGDYSGLRVLDYYVAYRALVRTKVALIRAAEQAEHADRPARPSAEVESYLRIAKESGRRGQPALVIMHGLAGSGKTTVAQVLLEQSGAVRVRSDVERKRLHGLAARARTHSGPYEGIYAPDVSRATYDCLKAAVRDVIESGRSVIVDAAFLWRSLRQEFGALARELGVPFMIVSCRASIEELKRRVAAREARMEDASEAGLAVLEDQIVTEESLALDELMHAIPIDTELEQDARWLLIQDVAERMIGKP